MGPDGRGSLPRSGSRTVWGAATPRPSDPFPSPSRFVLFLVADPSSQGIGASAGGALKEPLVTTRFVPISALDALDDWLPRAGVVVLFLHAPHCGISVRAYDQMASLGGEVALVNVARDREVKRAVAERTGVRHESPQVIVLRRGRAVWVAAHGAITTAAVARARQEAEPRTFSAD